MTLHIFLDRVFPHQGLSYFDWNDPREDGRSLLPHNTFSLPIGPPRSQGFTAVVLTYDRLESLFRVLERLSKAPSCQKLLVVWNNQLKDPPPMSDWPHLAKPLQVKFNFNFLFPIATLFSSPFINQVVRTKRNQLSNRFFPYPGIESDAILALDDDIAYI